MARIASRSEEHTSELQSHHELVCRLLLEKKKQHGRSRLTQSDEPGRPTPPPRLASVLSGRTPPAPTASTRTPCRAVLPACVFFFHLTPPTEIYTLSLHDALPI